MSTYRTASGKYLDINALKIQQEHTIAVGNMKVNARGDQLGAGGKIVRTRDEIMNEFYNNQKKTQLTDNKVHDSSEAAAMALAEDKFADVFSNGFDQIDAASAMEPEVITSKTPPATNGGINDALAKSQELAERLKKQRSRI